MHDHHGVHENVFRRHRVRGHTFNREKRASGIKRFPDDFAQFAAVDRVGKVHGELLEINLFGAQKADFFVRDKTHPDVAVRTVFTDHDIHGGHNVGNRTLVVRSQNGRTVGDHQVVALVAFDFGVVLHAQPHVFFFIEADVAPFVAADHLRMNVAGLTDVDGVHVRAPAHFRGLRARGQI